MGSVNAVVNRTQYFGVKDAIATPAAGIEYIRGHLTVISVRRIREWGTEKGVNTAPGE